MQNAPDRSTPGFQMVASKTRGVLPSDSIPMSMRGVPVKVLPCVQPTKPSQVAPILTKTTEEQRRPRRETAKKTSYKELDPEEDDSDKDEDWEEEDQKIDEDGSDEEQSGDTTNAATKAGRTLAERYPSDEEDNNLRDGLDGNELFVYDQQEKTRQTQQRSRRNTVIEACANFQPVTPFQPDAEDQDFEKSFVTFVNRKTAKFRMDGWRIPEASKEKMEAGEILKGKERGYQSLTAQLYLTGLKKLMTVFEKDARKNNPSKLIGGKLHYRQFFSFNQAEWLRIEPVGGLIEEHIKRSSVRTHSLNG